MENEIRKLQEAVEMMSTHELHNYLIKQIDKARNDSVNSIKADIDVFRLSGTKESMYFDRLVYFHEITKKLAMSISDCDKELQSNYNEWQILCKETKEKLEELNSTASTLIDSISGMLGVLTDGKILSCLDKEPLKLSLNALKKNEPLSWPDLEEALKKADYKPYGFDRLYSKLYIQAGEYENYCHYRAEALEIVTLFKSTEFESKINDYHEACSLKKSLEQKPKDIRLIQIEWRNALIKCFNVNYDSSKLRTESLMMI